MSAREVPAVGASLAAIMSVTWKRLIRGRVLYVAAGIALIPVLVGAIVASYRISPQKLQEILTRVVQLTLCLLPGLFVASSIGEDIEDRTTTYLWSRPIARWVVLVGKLGTLVPVVVVLSTISWVGANAMATGRPEPVASILALAAGTVIVSLVAAGIATLAPRHGMALSIGYLALLDLFLGHMPISIRYLSVFYHQRVLVDATSEGSVPASAIALALLGGVWLAVGLWRIRRMEA